MRIEAQFTVGEYEIVILEREGRVRPRHVAEAGEVQDPRRQHALLPAVRRGREVLRRASIVEGDARRERQRDALAAPVPLRLGAVLAAGAPRARELEGDAGPHRPHPREEPALRGRELSGTSRSRRTSTCPRRRATSSGSFYAALYDSTLAKSPKAVVTEYSWSAAACDPLPGPVLTDSDIVTLGYDAIVPLPEPGRTTTATSTRATARRPSISTRRDEALKTAVPRRRAARPAEARRRPEAPDSAPLARSVTCRCRTAASRSRDPCKIHERGARRGPRLQAAPPIVGGREVMAPPTTPPRPRSSSTGASRLDEQLPGPLRDPPSVDRADRV